MLYPPELLALIDAPARDQPRSLVPRLPSYSDASPAERVAAEEGGATERVSFRACAEAKDVEFAPTLERAMGIEPTYPAWKAGVLPLNYARKFEFSHRIITLIQTIVNIFVERF